MFEDSAETCTRFILACPSLLIYLLILSLSIPSPIIYIILIANDFILNPRTCYRMALVTHMIHLYLKYLRRSTRQTFPIQIVKIKGKLSALAFRGVQFRQ